MPVSPVSPSRFFTQRGLDIMQAEVLPLWLPTAALAIVGAVVRGGARSAHDDGVRLDLDGR